MATPHDLLKLRKLIQGLRCPETTSLHIEFLRISKGNSLLNLAPFDQLRELHIDEMLAQRSEDWEYCKKAVAENISRIAKLRNLKSLRLSSATD